MTGETLIASRQPRDWLPGLLAGEARAWLFAGKTVLAIYAAAWLAMWLRLEQPSTTMITVAIVMHPQSGMVLAKSFYRVLGTLAGSLFGVLLVAAFPQQRVLFLGALSLWTGLCAGGATLYRNFMAYAFVLAGYTAAIVVLPAISAPEVVFHSAVMRVSEVLLGIFVAAAVSDLVFPRRLRAVLRQSAREQFDAFIDLVREGGPVLDRPALERAHLASVRAAVRLENLRASVVFEDPEARTRSARMRLLNQRYMAASTSFHSLHHLVGRLHRRGRAVAAERLTALYADVPEALALPAAVQHDPATLATRLRACLDRLRARTHELDRGLDDRATRLEFHAGATLMQRFVEELADFVSTEEALRSGRVHGVIERVHFRRGADVQGAGVAVLRTFLTMAGLSALWVATGWNYGAGAMLLATIFSGLLAAVPNPLHAVMRTLLGYASGLAAGFVVMFALLPGSSGFPMLIAASAGLLLIGPYLIAHPDFAGIGTGYTLGFVYILALKNPMVYDPLRFLNDSLAQIAGLALSGAAFMVLPGVTGTAWQRHRLLRRLRDQVAEVASAPLEGLGWRFESVSRDLLVQIVEHTRPGSDASRELLAWALAVHEGGRAVIELRQDLAAGDLEAAPRAAAEAAVRVVADVYRAPSAAARAAADAVVLAAIRAAPVGAMARRHLYQLLSALRDEESPLAAAIPPVREVADAA